MKYEVGSKSHNVGDMVKVVPWMSAVYAKLQDRKGTIIGIKGLTADVTFGRAIRQIPLEHLEKTH